MYSARLSRYLKGRTKELKLNNTEIAQKAGISRQTWYKLLNADIGEAKLSTIAKLSKALHVPPEDIISIYFRK